MFNGRASPFLTLILLVIAGFFVVLFGCSGGSSSLSVDQGASDTDTSDTNTTDGTDGTDEPSSKPDTENDNDNDGADIEPGPLNLAVTSVTSSSVSVSWKIPDGTASIKLYISPEPDHGAVLEATLGSNDAAYVLKDIAPSVDVFIRVDAEVSGSTVTDMVVARTLGGPRAVLDGVVREVHGYAPNILQVVVADGKGWQGKDANGKDVFDLPGSGVGPALQSGPWTLTRADGRDIKVDSIYRHSIPVSADRFVDNTALGNGYLPAVGGDYTHFFDILDDSVTAIDHRIYLVLDEDIGPFDVIRLSGPLGISFTLPFSDRYLETPVIQLNQVGYNPRASKRFAYVSGWIGDGGPLDLSGFPAKAEILIEHAGRIEPPTTVVDGIPISLRANCAECPINDADVAGVEVRQIDLSSVPASETSSYRVRIPGVGVSWRTEVSERATFRAYYVLNRGLFFQRWGGDLNSDVTAWSRPTDHSNNVFTGELIEFNGGSDVYYTSDTPMTGGFVLKGGYHDAGDFDQRPMHTAVAQLLLRAYDLSPGKFTDGQLNIPESSNDIPDIMDQALWGISLWSQLQDPLDGGIRMGVQSYSHPKGYYTADQDRLPYWTFGKDAKVTARAAGLFAQASRLMSLTVGKEALAAELRSRAVMAYEYAVAHMDQSVYAGLLYGAGELYKLTGETKYRDEFDSVWGLIDAKAKAAYGDFEWTTPFEFVSWSLIPQQGYKSGDYFTPDFFVAYYSMPEATSSIKQLMSSRVLAMVTGLLNNIEASHAHRSARGPTDVLDWGGGSAVTKCLDPLISYAQMTGAQLPQEYLNALSLSMDYLLGGNPNGTVYVTGLGLRRPEEPLHTDSLAFIRLGNKDGIRAPMPGIPSYGTIDSPGGGSYYQPSLEAFYPDYSLQPKGYRFTDTRPFVMSSEFDVWQVQAPEVEAAAILVGDKIGPSVLSGTDDCGIDHCMDLSRYKR